MAKLSAEYSYLSKRFYWTLPGNSYPIYLSDNLSTPSAFIELPYFCSQAPGTGSCEGFHNVVPYQFNGPLPSDQDIHPEDGWELLLKNFGTPNPVGQSTGGKRVGNPYYILYNRHTGKMKVFMALMGIHDKQAAFIRIGFDNPDETTRKGSTNQATRALFNGAEAIQKTAEEFKPVLEFKQMNQVMFYQNASDYQWTVCELTTTYDPCTCENPTEFIGKQSTAPWPVSPPDTFQVKPPKSNK